MRIKAGIIKHKVLGAVGVLGLLLSFSAAANPEGGVVAAGSATITNADKLTTIKQATDKAVIDWRSFNIAPDEHTEFKQPSASSITLNRINDTNPSAINGRLTANGHVMLVNPNGILFGKNSVIDVAAITASTADIHNKNFMQGNMIFNKAGKENALIQNDGLITAKEAGLANFVAPRFLNSGIITAKLGKIQVGSGETFTLDMAGDGLLKVAINKDTRLGQQIINQGLMSANGGQVRLTAAAAREVVDSVISNSGIIEATSLSEKNGVIRLEGNNSTVINSGIINASGRNKNERGGDITITGKNVALMDGTLIDASGHTGKSNTTNDKTLTQKREGAAGGDIKIGGDYLGKGDTPTAENLYVSPNSYIFNDALNTGDAGRTIFWSDNVTSFYGNVFARALNSPLAGESASVGSLVGGGNGGFVETSGKIHLNAGGFVDLTATNGERGTYFLDPTDIAIYGNVDPAFNSTDGTSISLSSSLRLWLDASDQTTLFSDTGGTTAITNGGSIARWNDKSGQGNNATQSTAGNRPTWNAAAQNSLGVAYFDATAGMSTTLNLSAPFSIFAFFNRTSTSGNGYGRAVQGSNNWLIGPYANTIANFGGSGFVSLGIPISFGQYYITNSINNSTSTRFYNGSSDITVDSSPTGAPGNIGLGIEGAHFQEPNLGNIPEVIAYSTALSTNPRNLIEQYQSAKWGITLTPPGTGATEVAMATASDGYSVFTTRYLERLSTSANISLQATNNIMLDLKGDNLNFTTANRSLTLNAGNQIINASAGTITTNNGAISLTGTTGGIVLNNALTLNSGTATTTFASPINGANNLIATAGTFSFASPLGGTTPLSAVSLTSTNSVSLPAITSTSILTRTTGAGADITLGGNLSGSAAGTAITIASADDFFNSGNYTLTTGGAGGRWLIYSDKPADNNLGTLTGGFNRYTCTYAAACPTFGATGNGLLYSYTPTLTITPSAISALTYGAAAPSLVGYAYGATGYLGSDSEILTGSLTGTTSYTAGSPVASYNINYSSGSLTSPLGYGFTYANNASAITVNKADLTLTADNKTKVSGTANPTFTGTFAGFVGGQDLGTSGITGDAAFTTSATNGSPAGAYAIIASLGTLTSTNYNFATFVDGTLTVTAAPGGGGGGRPGGNPPPVIVTEPPVVVIPPQPPVTPPLPPTTRPEFTIDIQRIVDAPRRYAESSSALNPYLRHSSSSSPFRKLDVPFPFEYDTREVLFFHPDLQKQFGLPNRQEEDEEQ